MIKYGIEQSCHIPEQFRTCIMDRVCGSCGNTFTPTDVIQKYCTPKCGDREVKRRQKAKQRKNRAQLAIIQYARMTGVLPRR